MAYMRRGITTRCRFDFQGTEADSVWYPAAADAPVLPYPSIIRPLSDCYFPYAVGPIGEVYGASRTLNHKKTPPFLAFQHVCGTREDFAVGGTLNDVLPLVVYDKNQIPVCCQPAFVGEGGAAASGVADITVTPGTASSYLVQVPGRPDIVADLFTGSSPPFWDADQPNPVGAVFVLSPDIFPGIHDWMVFRGLSGSVFDCNWNSAGPWDGNGIKTFYPGPFTDCGVGNCTVTRLS